MFLSAAVVLAAAWAEIRALLPNSDFPWAIFLYVIPFLLIQNWMALRSREKRERHWAALPVAAWSRGVARTAIWLGVGGLVFGLAVLCTFFLAPGRMLTATVSAPVLILWGLLGVYMCLRDVLLHFWRHNRFYPMTPERSKSALMGLVLVLNLLGLLLFMMPAARGTQLQHVIQSVVHHWLFNTLRGLLWLGGGSLTLAALSSYTYSRKHGFLE